MMAKSKNRRKRGAFPAWTLDLIRGLISLGLGLGLLLWRSLTLSVIILILALNILVDGVFDILAFFKSGRKADIGLTHLVIGILSCLAAGLVVLKPSSALTFFLYYIAARAGIHGVVDLWELVTSFRQREASLLLLVRGVLWLLLSVALVLAPRVALDVALGLFALFFIIDGLGSFASAAVRSGRIAPRRRAAAYMRDDASANVKPPRAIVFVRRSGANGFGHVGWAFEWGTGWFNTGSVENRARAAFASPDKMDFWATHTLHPVATMLEQPGRYDEFKVFYVTDPQPKEAWKTVVWVSRQPYSVVRRNCSDSAYDVLRSYGVPNLVDTAQENVPNRWYDSLPGCSYPIAHGTEIPLDPARAARLAQLPTQEIKLQIPAHLVSAPPAWRGQGGRAWYEAQQRVRRVIARSRQYTHDAVVRTRTRSEHKDPSVDHRTFRHR